MPLLIKLPGGKLWSFLTTASQKHRIFRLNSTKNERSDQPKSDLNGYKAAVLYLQIP